MLDSAKLKYYCSTKNITLEKLSEKMGINPATLNRKMSGNSDFYRHEILQVKNILGLSIKEMNEIFFNEKLA